MSAVLTSELYEVPLPDSEQVAFTPTKDGLPVFHGKSYEDHKEAWVHVKESMECRLWALAAIAASLIRKHGDGAVVQFAKDMKVGKTWIYDLARTYRAFQNSRRVETLSFSHHIAASRAANPGRAIAKAADGVKGEWSVRELDRYVETGLEPGETSGITAESIARAALSDPPVDQDEDRLMMDHLLEAQAAVNALKEKCPRPQFVSDVYDGWSDDLTEYLEQFALASLKEKVIHAWRTGKFVEPEIAAHTGIPKNEIHGVMKAYQREGIFEKITRRKTEMAKGTRPWIWHLVGEPIGSDYEPVSYHDPNLGGNSDWENE
jgi:hypothetical protein